MTTSIRTDRGPAALTIAGLTALIAVLHVAGGGSGTRPPIDSLAAFEGWLHRTDPVTLGFTVVRVASLAVAYHLLIVLAVSLTGRALRRPRIVESAERLTLPPMRAVARRVVGLGLSAVALAGPATRVQAAPADQHGGTATLMVDDHGGARLVGTATAGVPIVPGEATLSVVVDEAVAPPPDAAVPASHEHVVVAGDHLWSIAEAALSRHLGHPPASDTVEGYWRQVILANPDLADPDLVFPGDVIVLPPPRHTG